MKKSKENFVRTEPKVFALALKRTNSLPKARQIAQNCLEGASRAIVTTFQGDREIAYNKQFWTSVLSLLK